MKTDRHRGSSASVMPDYRQYTLSRMEAARLVLLYLVLTGGIAWLFYDRIFLALPALPGLIPWLGWSRSAMAEARRTRLVRDFREALNSLSVSLKAGYSMENAFPAAARDLALVLGSDSDMTREMAYIAAQSRLSVPVDSLLLDFGRRSGLEDIRNFAAVFASARRMGGNLPVIIRSAAETIGSRIDVEREIETSLAAKKMEQRIMTAMPAGILLYMRLASPGFLDLMYTTGLGLLIMTGSLAGYGGAVLWSRRIVHIEL